MINTMPAADDLRTTFNKDAERYSRYRPHYPAALFDVLIHEARLTPASKLLEIGPGTGQATEPLAKLGSEITSIELGAALANKARAILSPYPHVDVVTGTFEDANLPSAYYDLVFSATAFHWVKDEYKFAKTARILKLKGYLAIIHTEHVSDGAGDTFPLASQHVYDRYWPPKRSDESFRLPGISELEEPAIDRTLFELKSFTTFPVTITYSAQDYAGLLGTYSPTIALRPRERRAFLGEIERLINERFDGFVKKRLAFTLAIVRKK